MDADNVVIQTKWYTCDWSIRLAVSAQKLNILNCSIVKYINFDVNLRHTSLVYNLFISIDIFHAKLTWARCMLIHFDWSWIWINGSNGIEMENKLILSELNWNQLALLILATVQLQVNFSFTKSARKTLILVSVENY